MRFFLWMVVLLGCTGDSESSTDAAARDTSAPDAVAHDSATDSASADSATVTDAATGTDPTADIEAVRASGSAGAYSFSVTIRSDETGCDLYANWWEVVRPDGTLVYRRILGHSHVDEQPFTRSGGPVPIEEGDEVIVRAHLHPHGYRGEVLRGSVATGFATWDAPDDFALGLASEAPLPDGCAF
ncbi:MAG: hypothetical protein AAGE52_06180 [Myxococcota bacterium]